MLEEIKKIQGINHNDFNSTINMWIEAAKLDLKSVGIVDTLVDNPDSLIKSAIITYVLSFLDVGNSELYANSYISQKDSLRHTNSYIVKSETNSHEPTPDEISDEIKEA